MTDTLSNLPQEVREALDKIRPDDGRPNSILHTQYVAWQTIRAELVRVTNELAALRARIDVAPFATVKVRKYETVLSLSSDIYDTCHNKRVRLVLDEGAQG